MTGSDGSKAARGRVGTRAGLKRRLFVVAGGALALLAVDLLLLRPWHVRWGATDEDVRQALPGDDLVPDPSLLSTRAITIRAPAADVWPWLVQMGKDRGGFYSYDWLENVLGFGIHSADRILPQFQHLKVGDLIRLHSNGPPLKVVVLDPECALVFDPSWAFVLTRVDGRTTRLIIRFRSGYAPDFGAIGNFVIWRALYEPARFVMERKMLVGIKERAEAAAAR